MKFNLFKPNTNNPNVNQQVKTAGLLRLDKDWEDFQPFDNIKVTKPTKERPDYFSIVIIPQKDSLWYGAQYGFEIQILASYPFEPPKVKCLDKIFHPNIDTEGNVCLNILRKDWKPVFNVTTILIGLNQLFIQDQSKFRNLTQMIL